MGRPSTCRSLFRRFPQPGGDAAAQLAAAEEQQIQVGEVAQFCGYLPAQLVLIEPQRGGPARVSVATPCHTLIGLSLNQLSLWVQLGPLVALKRAFRSARTLSSVAGAGVGRPSRWGSRESRLPFGREGYFRAVGRPRRKPATSDKVGVAVGCGVAVAAGSGAAVGLSDGTVDVGSRSLFQAASRSMRPRAAARIAGSMFTRMPIPSVGYYSFSFRRPSPFATQFAWQSGRLSRLRSLNRTFRSASRTHPVNGLLEMCGHFQIE